MKCWLCLLQQMVKVLQEMFRNGKHYFKLGRDGKGKEMKKQKKNTFITILMGNLKEKNIF